MNFDDYLKRRVTRLESALKRWLPEVTREPKTLHKAMHYSVFNGGKRVRPLLVYTAGEACRAPLSLLDAPAAAIEFMHTYSLIHDDLPAMDDDDLRRGKPSCHIAFDESTAILTGDALQSLAFEVIACDDAPGINDHARLEMIKILSQSCGALGMVGGQALDLTFATATPNTANIEKIHRLKTGALIKASLCLGALAAPELDPMHYYALKNFADKIGLAFQIQDDIFDEGNIDEPSYSNIVGINKALDKVKQLHTEALHAIETLDDCAKPLRALTEYLLNRKA